MPVAVALLSCFAFHPLRLPQPSLAGARTGSSPLSHNALSPACSSIRWPLAPSIVATSRPEGPGSIAAGQREPDSDAASKRPEALSVGALPEAHTTKTTASRLLPLAVLVLVPIAWGTYGVSIKELNQQETVPPEVLTTTLNYLVSSSALTLTSLLVASRNRPPRIPPPVAEKPPAAVGPRPVGASDASAPPSEQPGGFPLACVGGAELGGYLFAGGLLQISGIGYTTASRAAFLIQLTTVFVPLTDAASRRELPSRPLLLASAMAFGGVALMVGDQHDGGAGALAAGGSLVGDGLIVAAALFYSLNVVRLSAIAPRVPSITLALAKEYCRLGYATLTVLAAGVFSAEQAALLDRFIGRAVEEPASVLPVFSIIAWTGTATTAFPTWAMSYGQRTVSAAAANIIYTTQPLWAALFSYLLLGETLGPQGLAGAGAISAALAVIVADGLGNPLPPDGDELHEDPADEPPGQ